MLVIFKFLCLSPQIYTYATIEKLKRNHDATHPAKLKKYDEQQDATTINKEELLNVIANEVEEK